MRQFRTNRKTGNKFPLRPKRRGISIHDFQRNQNKTAGVITTAFNKLAARNLMLRKSEATKEDWNYPLYNTGVYSLEILKKRGILDYYVSVEKGGKPFVTFPLRPLIQKGISYGLSTVTGVPMDVGYIAQLIQKGIDMHHLTALMDL